MTPQVGSIVANRFELIRELGRGSMGTVWLADHLTLQVRCAVKFMTGEHTRDPNYAARFEREARAIAKLTSPNVVRVLDYDVHEGLPFIAMECLQGEDLGVRLQRVGRLDPETTYRIISQVAHGLAKAHGAGIVHRDLKPDNIFLAQEDDTEIAKLVDFGIAKMTGFATDEGLTSSTQAGSLVGTPAYMSPEQARGVSDLDHRSDLWSLAVIAFECLTGRLPFASTSLGDLFAQILFEPMPIPSQLGIEGISPHFDTWWARAASREASERFGTATELAEWLGRALGVSEAVHHEAHSTLRAVEWAPPLRPTRLRPRSRMSKIIVVALALAVAPLALMISSGRIDARSSAAKARAAGAASLQAPLPAPSRGDALRSATTDAPAPVDSVTTLSPYAEGAADSMGEPNPSGSSAQVTRPTQAIRHYAVQATPVSPQSSHVPRPRGAASSAPAADDVDFGI